MRFILGVVLGIVVGFKVASMLNSAGFAAQGASPPRRD
jgi:hypothetical protein